MRQTSSSSRQCQRIKELGDSGKRVSDSDLMAVAMPCLQWNATGDPAQAFAVVSGSNMMPTAWSHSK
jgi:hypothetical protein